MSLNVLASILSERLFHTWKDTTTKSTALALQACAKVFSCFASMVQPQQLAELGPSAFYRFVRLSFQPAGQLRSPEDQHGLRSSDCCWHWLGLGESFIFHGEKGAPCSHNSHMAPTLADLMCRHHGFHQQFRADVS